MLGPLPLRVRLGLVAMLTLLTVGVALAPGRLSSPIRKLANYRADTRDPIYNYPLDPPVRLPVGGTFHVGDCSPSAHT